MTGRQVQGALDAIEACLPAGCGQSSARAGRPAHRLEREIRLPQFHARDTRVRAGRDEEGVAAQPRALQRERGRHVEAPVAPHRARDLVDGRQAAVVEVEPQLAAQGQAIVVHVGESAAALDDRELRIGGHAKRRQALPFRWYVGLCRVNGIGTFSGRNPQAVIAGKAPDFLAGPAASDGFPGRRSRQGVCRTAAARRDRQFVASGADLNPQPAIRIEARRQRALQRERHEARRQNLRKAFLARVASDLKAHAGDETDGQFVLHEAVDLHLECRRLLGGAAFAKRDRAIRALGLGDHATIYREFHDARLGGDGQGLWPRGPHEAATQGIAAGRQAHGRQPVPGDDRGRRAVAPHVFGPLIEIAGKYHPAVGVHLPALREPPATGVDRERQGFGPGAAVGAGIVRRAGRKEGAAAEFLILENPGFPAGQLRGHVQGGGGWRNQGGADQVDASEAGQPAHAVLPGSRIDSTSAWPGFRPASWSLPASVSAGLRPCPSPRPLPASWLPAAGGCAGP